MFFCFGQCILTVTILVTIPAGLSSTSTNLPPWVPSSENCLFEEQWQSLPVFSLKMSLLEWYALWLSYLNLSHQVLCGVKLRVPPLCNSGMSYFSCSACTIDESFPKFLPALLFSLTLFRLWGPFRCAASIAETNALNINRIRRKSPILSSLFADGIMYFFLIFSELRFTREHLDDRVIV